MNGVEGKNEKWSCLREDEKEHNKIKFKKKREERKNVRQ